jgi:hypothetical protein
MKKTHEEYMAIAKVLGEHVGCELNFDPFSKAIALMVHFIKNPSCPLCLERIEKSIEKRGDLC